MGRPCLEHTTNTKTPRVLLVDPLPDCLGILRTQCRRFDSSRLDLVRDPVEALGKTTRSEYDWIILDVADLGDAAAALIVVLREFDAGVRILALNNRMTGKAWAHPGIVVADKRNVAPVCDRLLCCEARRPGRTGSRPE